MGKTTTSLMIMQKSHSSPRLDKSRLSIKHMARLFERSNEAVVTASPQKLMVVRHYKRAQEVGDVQDDSASIGSCAKPGTNAGEAWEESTFLTAVPTVQKRHVLRRFSAKKRDIGSMCDVQIAREGRFGKTSRRRKECNATSSFEMSCRELAISPAAIRKRTTCLC
ncbi:MAG: hypothetical protein IPH10_11240 [bacterium]|nr:hypothetical protein [bacterium]